MTMYSELLLASFEQASAEGEPGELLARLIACRHRLLSGPEGGGEAEPASDLAANIAYDLALLRLCGSRGIDCDPRLFGQPLAERRRLEEQLAVSGINLAELSPAS